MKEVSMPRLSEEKRNELEAFWRAQIQGWRDSTLNQREYCEAHGLPLKRFGNWRAKFRDEDPRLTGKLLYRRRGGSEHMLEHMRSDLAKPYIPSGRSGDACRRRNFGIPDKRRIVEEASRPGATVSGVAKKYGIGPRLLFQWKKDLMPDPQPEPVFAQVKLSDAPDGPVSAPPAASAPVIVERSAPGIEVELVGGRRVRFDRETDPEMIRQLVTLLEGAEQ
jgi:transposase